MAHPGLLAAALLAVAGLWPSPAAAADAVLRRAVERELPAVERALAAGTSPEAAQRQYDAARRLEGALPPLGYVSAGCRPLARDLLAYAAGAVVAAEGVDRLQSWRRSAGLRRADRALARVDARRRTCRSTARPRGVAPQPDVIASPRSGEASFGEVFEENYGDEARVYANGRLVQTIRTSNSDVRFTLRLRPGRYRLEIRFLRAGRVVWRSVSRDVYLLAPSARVARPPRFTDSRRNRAYARIAAAFTGQAAVYVQDLRTGRTSGWNADARFPAASTVKLAVAIAAATRWVPHRQDLRLDADLRALTGWSSNLAANRLVELLGDGSEAAGARVVERTLRRFGAERSTYPQGYRVGTGADREPPLVSGRVTTARDLGSILRLLAAAAADERAAQRHTGLSGSGARYVLGLLLQGVRRGNNVGLLAPALSARTPIAQKNGWIRDARHTAAIVYGPRGPAIVVVLTYRERLSYRDARDFARLVVRAAL